MTISQILSILRARWALIVLVFGVTTLTALGISLLLPKQYVSEASVVVDVKSLDPVAGTVLPGMFQPGYMSTQVDIVNSERVAERVVRMLRLEEQPELRQRWMDQDKGKGEFVVWAAKGLQTKLDAKPSRDSNIIQIGFRGTDPDFVAKAANAFAQAYVDVDLELKTEPAKQYAQFFGVQTDQARLKLEEAQAKLSAYQQAHGIVVFDQRLDAETSKINDLSSQLTLLQGQIADSDSKRASKSAGSTEAAMNSSTIATLKTQIAQLNGRLQESSGNLGPQHPQTLRTKAQLASLRADLDREIGQIQASFDTTYRIDKQREQQLRSALDSQKTRVLLMNKQRDEVSVLRRDLDAAQRDYDTMGQRFSIARLESQASKTNISILSPATVPLSSAKPKVLLNTAAAALVGLMLGLVCAVTLELANRRIRSPNDLAIALDVPVLARVSGVKHLNGRGARRPYQLRHEPTAI